LHIKGLFGLVLAIVGATVALGSEVQLRSAVVSITAEFGFCNYLPFTFFVGLLMLLVGICLIFEFGSTSLLVLTLVVLAITVWGLPVFALEQRYHIDAYWHFSTTQWLLESGRIGLNLFKQNTRLVYLQYPSLFVGTTEFESISSLGASLIMPLFALGAITFFVVAFYILAHSILHSERRAAIAVALAIVGNGAMFSTHYSPSALGEALFPLMIFVLFQALSSSYSRYWILLGILTFFSVTLNLEMSLLLLIVVFAIMIFPNRLSIHPENKKVVLIILLFIGSVILVWNVFLTNWGLLNLSRYFADLYGIFLNAGKGTVLQTTILQRQVSVFPLVGWIKRGIFLGFVVPAVIISVRDLFQRKVERIRIMFFAILVTWLLVALVTDVSDRILVWTVPFSALILVDKIPNIRWNKLHIKRLSGYVLFGILFLLAISTLITSYSGAAVYITTQAESSGYYHIVTFLKNNDRVYVYVTSIDEIYFYTTTNITLFQAQSVESAQVIIFNRNSYSYYYFTNGGNATLYSEALDACLRNPTLQLAYSNPDFVVFQKR
jgi:hypothetical protein